MNASSGLPHTPNNVSLYLAEAIYIALLLQMFHDYSLIFACVFNQIPKGMPVPVT